MSTTLNLASRLPPPLAGAVAFPVFVRPLGRARLRPAEHPLFAQAVTERIDLDGAAVTTYRWGEGERPVLVVHGWSSRASRLAGIIEALRARGHTVVSYDAPGHGTSGGRAATVLDMRTVIRRLHRRYGDFSGIVAHSIGVLATFFSLRDEVHADRVAAIGGVASFDHLVEQFRDRLGLRPAVGDALRHHVRHRLAPGEPGVLDRLDVRRRPEEISAAPVLLLHDTDDDTVPADQSRAMADAFGERAELVLTSGLGHRRILADPQVITRVAEFITPELPTPAATDLRVATR
ncbi:alpha/beta hydrolase [Streptomyces sp. NPDC012888]|uniref:alpha/beta hydrolase n=1 Tax=Streptomyces sp. NPDC012888 TaxID=3364855 RepID=UPI00369DBA6B